MLLSACQTWMQPQRRVPTRSVAQKAAQYSQQKRLRASQHLKPPSTIKTTAQDKITQPDPSHRSRAPQDFFKEAVRPRYYSGAMAAILHLTTYGGISKTTCKTSVVADASRPLLTWAQRYTRYWSQLERALPPRRQTAREQRAWERGKPHFLESSMHSTYALHHAECWRHLIKYLQAVSSARVRCGTPFRRHTGNLF